jgi:hypothetical protein
MKVVWGKNTLIDCVNLLGWGDQSVLRVREEPLRVDLSTPATLPSQVELRVEGNVVRKDSTSSVRVSADPHAVTVVWKEVPILMAFRAEGAGGNAVYLRVDLRPLGMKIFDDSEGLHVGGTVLADHELSGCSTAILLG